MTCRRWLAAAVLAACVGPAAPADAALTGNDLLARLTDPVAPLPVGARVIQRSSRDREGGNRDMGVWSADLGRPPTYVRREPGGFVLLDERRPGCLARMWFTADVASLGSMANVGRLQLYFDGESAPRVDVAPADFFAGRVPGFPQPLVGDGNASSGGFYAYAPFCFARGLKVRVTAIPSDNSLWYQLTELLLPPGSAVETYAPGRLRTAAAADALRSLGAPPGGSPEVAGGVLEDGDRLDLMERRGAGSIRFLRIAVTPFTPATLNRLELRVRADGAGEPQLAVPLGPLFGDGLSVRPVRSLAFGMDPLGGRGYFALPIPFSDGVHAELVAHGGPARVRAEAWLGRPLPGAGLLHGRRTVTRARRGFDLEALDAAGSGRLAAWVLDLLGPPKSAAGPVQFFLEGDERVHVDGSPSPAIHGTGTEDAFNGGFYYGRGLFTLPTHGAGPPLTLPDLRGGRSQYRVFGADGALWENGIRFGIEHGGGDENSGGTGMSTAFWYASPPRLALTDTVRPAGRASARSHRLRGAVARRVLTAYFDGERDGNTAYNGELLFGGGAYPAPPANESPEGVTAAGVAFERPVSFRLAIAPDNCGVIVRRLLDAAVPSAVAVAVDGHRVGDWDVLDANPAKRWLSDDFPLRASVTAGRRRVRVTLSPAGRTATAFRVQALSRRCGR